MLHGGATAFVLFSMVVTGVIFVRTLIGAVAGDSVVASLPILLGPEQLSAQMPQAASVVDGWVEAEVEITTGIVERLVWWVVRDGTAGLWLVGLELVRRLLRTVDAPFDEANIARLRGLSAVAVLILVVEFLRSSLQALIMVRHGFAGVATSYSFNGLVAVLLLGVLMQVWRRGIELRLDRELTI